RALPAPEMTDAHASTQREPPRSGLEERLAESWRAVLRIPAVGRHDNFFELGGHSLLATQLMARLRSEMGIELGVRVLFEAPTLAQFAERLQDQVSDVRPPPLRRAPRTERIPLSFAQQRLWFLDQLEPGSPRYNIPAALRLSGRLDVAALQKAFEALSLRHDALRTTFYEESGQPWQRIHAAAELPLKVVDLSGIPEAQRQDEAIRLATRDARQAFSLSEGPLMRVTLMRLEPTEHVLLVNVHHTVSDGWSTGILVREVATLYAAFSRGLPSPLPELPIQYADFARWQRDWLQGKALDAQLAWWKQELAGAPHALELPTDKVRPKVLSAKGEALPVHLPVALASALEALAQREGATPFMVLLAAFQSLLHRYSGQDDVLVGSPIANRRLAETEPLIGFFVNTLVLRARFSPASSFRSLLAQVRDSTLGAFEHQDIPFERLVEELQPARDLGRTPLFQAMFSLQNAPAGEVALPELKMRGVDMESDTTLFELNLSLSRAPDGYRGVLTFSTDLFEAATARRWMTHFERLLEGAVAAPTQPLRSLSLLTSDEQAWLMREGTGPEAYFPRTACLHQVFEQQVARSPDAVAIVAEQETVSFLQLNARANQLARYLRGLGVGPEVPVALCVERSIDALVAILGILKAGGAYVPLDPSAPTQRTALLLRDSGASVLISRRRLLETWPLGEAHLVDLDTAGPEIAALASDDLTHHTTAENLAYVIYTSGSTGTPKGVMVQHRSVLHIHRALARSLYEGQRSGLRVAFNAPLYFDVSVDHLVQLLDGHSLHLMSEETRRDPERMLEWLEQGHVDVLGCTPAQAKLLLQAGLLTRAHVPRLMVLAGEAVDESLWRTLSETTRTRAFNGYGPTEATVLATTWRMQGTEVPVPVIGRPLSNSAA
ncbi:AMP-binding protein, partial [Myxococcaceae bacterium JPH2]|nr:AMP-binding protein [Myxococcaceae bacterium JPH2]